MKLREYHPLSEMERVPAEELPKRLDELFDRMDKAVSYTHLTLPTT